MRNPLFKVNGKYVGFVEDGYAFDRDGSYLGWLDNEGSFWNSGGHFVGQLTKGGYIVRSDMTIPPIPRIPLIPPIPRIPPIPEIDRLPRIPSIGYSDALGSF